MALFEPGPVDPLQLHSKTGPTAHHAFDSPRTNLLASTTVAALRQLQSTASISASTAGAFKSK